MKFFIAFVALFAVALAAPPQHNANGDVQILSLDSEVNPDSYNYAFQTSDGTNVNSQGHLNNIGSEHESLAVSGSFSYVGDDGQTYQVNYVADENGFQPQGAHLPVAPEA